MSQWTVLLLLTEPGVEYLLQGAALHHYLPNQDAVPDDADWRVLLYLDLKQILTRQNLPHLLPAGVPSSTAFETRHSWWIVSYQGLVWAGESPAERGLSNCGSRSYPYVQFLPSPA